MSARRPHRNSNSTGSVWGILTYSRYLESTQKPALNFTADKHRHRSISFYRFTKMSGVIWWGQEWFFLLRSTQLLHSVRCDINHLLMVWGAEALNTPSSSVSKPSRPQDLGFYHLLLLPPELTDRQINTTFTAVEEFHSLLANKLLHHQLLYVTELIMLLSVRRREC